MISTILNNVHYSICGERKFSGNLSGDQEKKEIGDRQHCCNTIRKSSR